MYPQLRVVCTGHGRHRRSRGQFALSDVERKQSAHLLESGVIESRVCSTTGEARVQSGALDRRVEVSFFVND